MKQRTDSRSLGERKASITLRREDILRQLRAVERAEAELDVEIEEASRAREASRTDGVCV
jgi:hypothetical protein